MVEHDLEFPTAMLLYDENGMSDDRRIRVGHNEFMGGYLRLAATRKHRRGNSEYVIIFRYRIVDIQRFRLFRYLNSRQEIAIGRRSRGIVKMCASSSVRREAQEIRTLNGRIVRS